MQNEIAISLVDAFATPTIQLHRGDVWAADDPLVKAHPDWFTLDVVGMANRSTPRTEVPAPNDMTMREPETMTAAPGERRTTQRSRASA